jgi:positive regulator of sigma E activity
MYNFLKKFYASRLQQASTNQFSPLMVGPVVVLDISEEQLSKRAQMIYGQLKSVPTSSTESKAS